MRLPMNRRHYSAVILVCAFNLIYLSSISCKELYSLGFHELVVDQKEMPTAEYDLGNKLYPNFASEGLPEKFYIKKQASLTLDKNDIDKITIAQEKPYPDIQECYRITVYLSQKPRNDLKLFSGNNIKKKFAIKIGNDIFSIVTIVSELSSEMATNHCGETLEGLLICLSKISSNIVVEEGPDEIG